ncbi:MULTISPECIES: LysR substrate-binding domain-containing protein [unclassified Halomonas]|uniref:LysR substrate-binding domain-containing protein n=1 Tax=unclassified Halomonas TaxID=2609666 RepID=UPI002888793A|nr:MULTISPECIES: LysR substrate-binding domain-containing protein [unclassified Halomonas]MDT0500344.1 LysR substrate-binding domain-containing protein [Halomonas sp. PAR7]MDT0511159.1 LysR substrate-binding domain-containing protein [Halomonas sp. LES1]MDT0590552.1 LysR substrate-binding domain-containing protein [Halomonas sp. PAR8]
MKFQQLNAFKAVYELGSVTAAGERLHLTQPAVSKLITALERRVDFKLFERIKGRLVPTDQGKAFYLEVVKAFTAMDSLAESARDIRTHHWGSLHVDTFPLLAHNYLPRLLGKFLKQAPELNGTLKAYRSEEVLRRTEIQSCDVGFAAVDNPNCPGVHSTEVRCSCVAILPPGSPLAEKAVLTPEDFVSQPFIRSEMDVTQRRVNQVFSDARVVRRDVLEVSFASSTAALVAEGIGAAIIDPFTAHHAKETNPDIMIKSFVPNIPFHFHILFPALRPVPPSVEHFVESFFAMAREDGISLQRLES